MTFKHVHIIGVCGTLMGSFAAYLKRAGMRVTGSDQNVYPPMSDVLSREGVELFSPYSEETFKKISGTPDLVVVGNVISKGNPEMNAVEAKGLKYVSLPEFMEQNLLPQTRNLVVSGTHGKTTTSSIMAHVLIECGMGPSYFIGGVSHNLPHSFHVETKPGLGKFFVLEGDEYDTAFWDKVPKFNHYLPNDVVLTSVEYDHADIYPDLNAVKKVFFGLVSRIRTDGRLIACIETENVREIIKTSKVPVITYSRFEKDGADYEIRNVVSHGNGIQFEVFKRDGQSVQKVESLQIQLTGEYNALNALAVWIECNQLGIAKDKIKAALASFKGVKRRQEEIAEVNGVLVIDDFAHHPTAVKETIQGLRMKYKGRRLVTVFEPRSATSRRKVFQKEYTDAFCGADETFIAIAYDQSKIPADQQFSSQELVAGLKEKNKEASFFESVDAGVKSVTEHAKPGDVIAVLSNGGFGGFIPKLVTQLKAR